MLESQRESIDRPDELEDFYLEPLPALTWIVTRADICEVRTRIQALVRADLSMAVK